MNMCVASAREDVVINAVKKKYFALRKRKDANFQQDHSHHKQNDVEMKICCRPSKMLNSCSCGLKGSGTSPGSRLQYCPHDACFGGMWNMSVRRSCWLSPKFQRKSWEAKQCATGLESQQTPAQALCDTDVEMKPKLQYSPKVGRRTRNLQHSSDKAASSEWSQPKSLVM